MRPLDPVAEALLGFESDAELVAMIDAVYRVHRPPSIQAVPFLPQLVSKAANPIMDAAYSVHRPPTHTIVHCEEESDGRRRCTAPPPHKSCSL